MSEVGKTASGELRCCNFTDDDECEAKQSIAYYKMQLEVLTQQLNNVEEKAKNKFGIMEK